MKALSKKQRTQLQELRDKLQEVTDAAQEAIAGYNDTLQEIEDFRAEVYGEMESYWKERSENWQEGERGEVYQDWMEQWSTAATDSQIDEPDWLSIDEWEEESAQ